MSATPDATDKATADVLTAYRAYWAAQVKAQAAPEGSAVAELSKYADGTALSGARSTVVLLLQHGIVVKGEPQLAPRLTQIDLSGSPKALISDCVDVSKWTPVFKTTGKSAVPADQAPRVLMESTAALRGGVWLIDTSVARRDQTC